VKTAAPKIIMMTYHANIKSLPHCLSFAVIILMLISNYCTASHHYNGLLANHWQN